MVSSKKLLEKHLMWACVKFGKARGELVARAMLTLVQYPGQRFHGRQRARRRHVPFPGHLPCELQEALGLDGIVVQRAQIVLQSFQGTD